jgi:hypothetical protein
MVLYPSPVIDYGESIKFKFKFKFKFKRKEKRSRGYLKKVFEGIKPLRGY